MVPVVEANMNSLFLVNFIIFVVKFIVIQNFCIFFSLVSLMC